MKIWSISAFVTPIIVMAAYVLWKQSLDWSILIALLPVCLMTCGFFRARRSLAAAKISEATPAGLKPGSRKSAQLYYFEMVFPYAWIGICSIIGILPVHTVIVFLTIAVALACASTMKKSVGQSPTLLTDLGVRTASLQLMFSILLSVALIAASFNNEESMEDLTARVFERAAAQMLVLDRSIEAIAETGQATYPRSISKDGSLWTSDYKWWCSGFYPGSLWLVYEYTGDEKYKNLALKYQAGLEPLRYRTDDHDIGFQLMCSYGNCLRITSDTLCIPVLTDGANSLATRFDPEVGCTRSWDLAKYRFPVIIDNMMNLELLFKAAELGGDDSLRKIAVTHAQTTMKNHFREDNSCHHVVDYDPETGEVIAKLIGQGYSPDSAWSRGQAWALYSYPMVYRFTQDKEMLDHAISIAEYILPRLPEDGIPYWDFDSPDIPNDVKDASAAAVMACGLIELSTYVDAERSSRYLAVAEKMIRSLASSVYLAEEGEAHGFLLKHSTGFKLRDSEVDAPLTYADYYFLEALMRWAHLDSKE